LSKKKFAVGTATAYGFYQVFDNNRKPVRSLEDIFVDLGEIEVSIEYDPTDPQKNTVQTLINNPMLFLFHMMHTKKQFEEQLSKITLFQRMAH